jgi:hypothetical protein
MISKALKLRASREFANYIIMDLFPFNLNYDYLKLELIRNVFEDRNVFKERPHQYKVIFFLSKIAFLFLYNFMHIFKFRFLSLKTERIRV